MCSSAAHPPDGPRPHDPCTSFLTDARSNLALVREVFGDQSTRYQRLVAHYRVTAEMLGCQAGIVQVLASLVPPSQSNPPRPS